MPSNLIALRDRALEIALAHVGVREVGGNNRGPEIDAWLAALGLQHGLPWCAAFVCAMYKQASVELSFPGAEVYVPFPRSGSVLRLWRSCPDAYRTSRPRKGSIFCHRTSPGSSTGHTGFVVDEIGGTLYTVEGNTNEAGHREGDGVLRRERPLAYVNLGFIDVGLGEEETQPGRTGVPSIHG